MKKLLFTKLLLLGLCLGLVSCSSDDDDNNNNANGNQYEDTPYSQLTPGQKKEKLNEDAVAFFTEMNGLSSSKALDALQSFYSLCAEYGAPELSNSPAAGKDIMTINDFYGKYTFNAESEEWIKSASANQLVLSFPLNKTSNSEIIVTGVSSNVVNGEIQLPKELNAKISIDGTQVGAIELKANLTSLESIPSSANVKFTFDEYTLAMDANKGNINTASTKLTKGSKVLLNGKADLTANLDNLSDENVKDGNIEIDLMDRLAIAGKVDFSSLTKEESKLQEESEYDHDSKEYVEALAKIYNKYYNLDLVSKTDGTKIAKVIFIAAPYEEGVAYSYYDEVLALQFDDNTIIEASVFFGSGFDKATKAASDFRDKFFN